MLVPGFYIPRSTAPETFGAVGDGVADDTAAWQAAVDYAAANGFAIVCDSNSTYLLSETVDLSRDTFIDFNFCRLHATQTDGSPVFLADGTSARVSHVTLRNLRLCEMDDAGSCLLEVKRGSDIRIENVETFRGPVLRTDLRDGHDPEDMEAELNRRISLIGFRFLGDAAAASADRANGVRLRYCSEFTVTNGFLNVVRSGIVWWGGDSNPGRDGGPGSPRWCRMGSITSCVVEDASAGGIWGSQGEDLSVVACQTRRCLDYGMHSEGGRRITFSACEATDCTYPFGAYFIDEQIEFVGCHGWIHDPDTYGSVVFKHNNGFNDASAVRIKWTGGTMGVSAPTAAAGPLGLVEKQHGGEIVFDGCEFQDVWIDASSNNAGRVVVKSCTFRLINDPGAAFDLISLNAPVYVGVGGQPAGIVADCWVDAAYAPADGSAFVKVRYSGNWEYRIQNNHVPVFPVFAKAESTSNAGTHYLVLTDNAFDGQEILDLSDDKIRLRVRSMGGRKYAYESKVMAPDSAPVTGLFVQGSWGYVQDAAHPERHKWLCTATGGASQGTWSSEETYVTNDQVDDGSGNVYRAIQGSTNQDPTLTSGYWQRIAATLAAFSYITA